MGKKRMWEKLLWDRPLEVDQKGCVEGWVASPFCSGDGVDGAGQDNGWPTRCIPLPSALSICQPVQPTRDVPTTHSQPTEISSYRM